MLDKPEKTRQLMATLKAALPFEVELTPYALAQIRSQGIDRAVEPRQIVSEVSYAGDEGGIVCHMRPGKRIFSMHSDVGQREDDDIVGFPGKPPSAFNGRMNGRTLVANSSAAARLRSALIPLRLRTRDTVFRTAYHVARDPRSEASPEKRCSPSSAACRRNASRVQCLGYLVKAGDSSRRRGWAGRGRPATQGRDWPAPARPPRSRERDHARLAVLPRCCRTSPTAWFTGRSASSASSPGVSDSRIPPADQCRPQQRRGAQRPRTRRVPAQWRVAWTCIQRRAGIGA